MAVLPDPDRVEAIIREAAELDILPRFQRLARHEVMEKKAGEVVTVADIEAERRLSRELAALVPGSRVVGEEAASRDPALLDTLAGEGPAWLVDPVDGTGNFAAGKPLFAVIVSFLVDGETRAGWIHDPVSATTATAVRGEGAWYGGERMRSASPVPLETMVGSLNYSWFAPHDRQEIRRRAHRFREIRIYRCAAHDYLALARGEKQFSLYRRLWPWDHAAGVLILAEAGGHTARLDGEPYRAFDRVQGLLSASDTETWERVRRFLAAA